MRVCGPPSNLPRMQIGSWQFSPGRWPTLTTLVLLAVLVSLGFWQLDRARQKRDMQAAYAADNAAPRVRIDASAESIDTGRYGFGVASGEYDSAHQFLLDNRTRDGAVGYEVLTPLRFPGSDTAVLVNRGWVPLTGDRSHVPELGVGESLRTVRGRIKPPSRAFTLGDEEARSGWPYRILAIDLERQSLELGYRLVPVILLLDADESDGYERNWRLFSFGPERNVGYAVQWFGLAVALLIIYLVVNIRRNR